MKLLSKFLSSTALLILLSISLMQCKEEDNNRWDIDLEKSKSETPITDISEMYYDTDVAIEDFKNKYEWFQGTVSDEDFIKRRTDSLELAIYNEAVTKVDKNLLAKELADLFAHVKYYYPQFQEPKVFVFSSALQMVRQSPIQYFPQDNYLFIDTSSFLGENNTFYDGLEEYFKVSMNSQNIKVKVADAIISNIVPFDKNNQKFIDHIVYHGKKQILMDAFLPEVEEHLKMNYSKKQYEWTAANEDHIWNYFVENDLVYSPDPHLVERFITEGPFSKFYTEVDQKSSPKVGIFIGWQICKSYLNENKKVELKDFLQMNATELFTNSKYNPNT